MTSNSETGHAKNLANFDEFILFIIGYGPAYNPSRSSILLNAMQALSAEAKPTFHAVNTAFSAYKLVVANRETEFIPLSKLATRILNAVKVTDTNAAVVDSVAGLVRKLQGKRASAKLSDEEKAAAQAEGKTIIEHSSSQMSYDSRVENFDKLLELLASIPEYKPNEDELKLTTLTAYYTKLSESNTAVVQATAPLSNARLARNEVLYRANTGVVDVAGDAKNYIKSLYGATSPQFKQVSKLKFVNLAK